MFRNLTIAPFLAHQGAKYLAMGPKIDSFWTLTQ